jgi:hypothetical protein
VRNKDIRKVRQTDRGSNPRKASEPRFANTVHHSSWTVCTFPRRATLFRMNRRGHGHGSCFFCVSGSQEWRRFIVACHVAKKGLRNKFQKAKR